MDLFDQSYRQLLEKEQPLAARMRPRTLEEFIGQEHIVGKELLLHRSIKADQLSSLIFYGPPGTGKTSLAAVIANATASHFVSVNAVLAGVKEIRSVVSGAQERRKLHNIKTILFVDEVHRWNKAQQDALLPWVENGTIILIGATIENPYFEVNKALVSRSRIFQLKPLNQEDQHAMAKQAMADADRGYGKFHVEINDDALEHLINVANGDGRSLLNALELAVETTPAHFPPGPGELIHIDMRVAEESIQRRVVLYDKEGDYHFDTISAFIKSLRGSDPDASLYWLAKMVYAGEDPHFIFRRMLIFASEDVGLADPNGLVVTEAAAAAFDRVGLPEGRFHLANAALYLATAAKSNSILAFFDALNTVEKEQEGGVPGHLKDGSRDKKGFGHGEGYLYPHAYKDHWVAQQYLPDQLQGKVFYKPGNLGYEAAKKEKIEKRREAQLAVMFEMLNNSTEVLTFGPPDRLKDRWLARASGSLSAHLLTVREYFFKDLKIARHWVVLDIKGENGLLTWELIRKTPEGGVVTLLDKDNRYLPDMIDQLPEVDRPQLITGDLDKIDSLLEMKGKGDLKFDLIAGWNSLVRRSNKEEILKILCDRLAAKGVLSLMENFPRGGQRLSELANSGSLDSDLLKKLIETENIIYEDTQNPVTNWDQEDFFSMLEHAGFVRIKIEKKDFNIERRISSGDLMRWFHPESIKQGFLLPGILTESELEYIYITYRKLYENSWIDWRRSILLIRAYKK